MQLTKEQAIEEHRKMWNWIADHVEEVKPIFAFEIKCKYLYEILCVEQIIHADCFCCDYTYHSNSTCKECILDWNDTVNGCCSGLNKGLYGRFLYNIEELRNYKEASNIARQIANLSERS